MAAHSLARSAASASALGELIPRLARQDAIVFDIAHGGPKSARTGCSVRAETKHKLEMS
jgi:hypothetical protein